MKSSKRPNAPHNQPWEVWEPARGYYAVALGKNGNPNLTAIRKSPKMVRGKAAVKALKRARRIARESARAVAA